MDGRRHTVAGCRFHLMAQAAFDVPYVPQDALTCIVANDLGRNGYYEQKPIAD